MPDLTSRDHSAVPLCSVVTQPSYTAQILTMIADELLRLGKTRVVNEPLMHRLFNLCTAAVVAQLPDPVANAASEKAGQLIGSTSAGNTHAEQAQILHVLASTV